ncbi:hypothetical protein V6N12_073550 [Hibiscus sabdariffa]|uniref:Very-long-chain 3-oxoacyl-CoA synthase n=1 Tax=Hibiscus sabdariffa TaxID=183260 RepID=A0ABR2BHF8_9ROSI
MDKLLTLMGKDPQIAEVATMYSIWLIPTLFDDAILQLSSSLFPVPEQNPPFLTFCANMCVHASLYSALVHKKNMGYAGAAKQSPLPCGLTSSCWQFIRYALLIMPPPIPLSSVAFS